MQGRRVDGGWSGLKQPGDYCPLYKDGELSGLVFVLPDGNWGRIANKGHGGPKTDGEPEPEWDITVNEDDTVTVKPSIDAGEGNFHGHLINGVWS